MLNRKVVIYVPSKIGQTPHPDKQAHWKRVALERFADMFGGATAQAAEGAWKSGDELVIEPVVIVYAFTDADGEARHRSAVFALAHEIAQAMQQDCVSVEIDGGLDFVAEAA
jgi:hypothetical protein